MLTILAKEWMKSGEIQGIKLQETITYEDVPASPNGNDFILRVNDIGQTYGAVVKNQDVEWVASNTTDVVVGSSETELVRLTIDQTVTVENGSWAFICKINNGSSTQDDFVTLILRDGSGTAIASKQYQIDKGDTGYAISFWGAFGQDWASGSEFIIYATSGKNSTTMGTLTPTTLKVVEAQAAAVTKVIQVNADLGNGISRGEIENAVGVSVSTLKDTQKYVIADNAGHAWFVVWLKSLDRFAITKLNLK